MRSMKVTAFAVLALSIGLCSSVTNAASMEADILPTPENSNSIRTIIDSQKRFVLYNSRRLSGECLEVCEPTPRSITPDPSSTPTESPSLSPTASPSLSPTKTPVSCGCDAGDDTIGSWKCGQYVYYCPGITVCDKQPSANSVLVELTPAQCLGMKAANLQLDDACVVDGYPTRGLSNYVCYHGGDSSTKVDSAGCDGCNGGSTPTDAPTAFPTQFPSEFPTASPSDSPTASPSDSPSKAPVPAPVDEGCGCEPGDEDGGTFKCGNHVYVCPGITQICSTTGSQNSQYYSITPAQCEAMKLVELGQKCVELPQHNIVGNGKVKGLSNRVCYNGIDFGQKEDGSCDFCQAYIEPTIIG